MFDILKPLLGIFSWEELESAIPISNICQFCKKECGNLFILDNCDMEYCGNCLDSFYDTYTPRVYDELFKCPCHGKMIFEFRVKK